MAVEWNALIFDGNTRIRRAVFDIKGDDTFRTGRIRYLNTVMAVCRHKGGYWQVCTDQRKAPAPSRP